MKEHPNIHELPLEELAEDCFVDHGKLVQGWLAKARGMVRVVQEHDNDVAQIGGPGVQVSVFLLTRTR